MMNQRQRILAYIDQFGSISPFEAFVDLGITKLASRVSELIYQDGIPIKKEKEYAFNRYGEKVHYMRYSREEENGGVHKDTQEVA
jgi:hypothetical protein